MYIKEYGTHCKKGYHDLIEVYRSDEYDHDDVVRWCRICGSIVIDREFNEKLEPGGILEIMHPLMYGEDNE
jgi:hypothetical protein